MSPTVFRWKGYRSFFFSREETRVHVHVSCPDGEAKFWLEPTVGVAKNYGRFLSPLWLSAGHLLLVFIVREWYHHAVSQPLVELMRTMR